MDYIILKALVQLHTPLGDWLMPKITVLCNHGDIWILCAIVLLLIPKTRKWGIAMAVALLLANVLGNTVIKHLVERPRPFRTYPEFLPLLISPPGGYSFPSGHTGASFAAAVALFRFDRKWGAAALVLAALIGFSRLYLTVHYPTDVLGGLLLGTACGLFAAWAVKAVSRKVKNTKI